jgi:arginine N-succinyltransferase
MIELHIRSATTADLPRLAECLGRPVGLPSGPHEHLLLAGDGAAGAGVLGLVRLRPAVGLDRPRVSYHVGCNVHAAPELGLFHRQRTLLLGHDHTGASELADLAVAADGVPLAVRAAVLQQLLAAALLTLAAERAQHAPRLIAELPGVRDSSGRSPFWQGLGRHFYAGDPAAAAAEHGPAWRSLVAALLPRQVIYAAFLPPEAQAAIAQTAPSARLLLEALEAAGLRYGHHVNVDDAGPVLEAECDQLPGVVQARVWRLQALDLPAPTPAGRGELASAGKPTPTAPAGACRDAPDEPSHDRRHDVPEDAPRLRPWMLRWTEPGGTRALQLPALAHGSQLLVDPGRLMRLALSPGQSVWAAPLSDAGR